MQKLRPALDNSYPNVGDAVRKERRDPPYVLESRIVSMGAMSL